MKFVVSRLLLWLKVSLPLTAVFSHEPLVQVRLTPNPIAHTTWLATKEPPEVAVFKQHIIPTAIVFDIGANVGTHALLAAKLAENGKVYAFEPGKEAYAALTKNIVLNSVTNLVTYNAAVSTEETGWDLVQPGRSDEQSFLVPTEGATSAVTTVRLDAVLSEQQISKINFLKIDVEGAELLVLRSLGERVNDVEKIFFENIPRVMERFGYTQAELGQFLTGHGFKLYSIILNDGSIDLQLVTDLASASQNVLATR